MGVYLRGKSYYFNFYYEGKRYNEKIGQVSKSVAEEKLNIKRSEVICGGRIGNIMGMTRNFRLTTMSRV